jgi:hypothetical protein
MRLLFKTSLTSIVILLLLAVPCTNDRSGQDNNLPRSTPEAEGINSDGIIAFLKATEKEKHEFHSFMFLRHGKVIAEAWWSPYAPDLKHTLYSTSKSFTSTAVGFAVSDSLIKVSDKVISFFPENLPDTVSPYLDDMEIKDLLSMSAGLDPDPTGIISVNNDNWVKAFLALPVVNDPGTKFLYNSMATYMLSAIVQKVTGQPIIDYLTPRLFDPLGISGIDRERDPMGINTGGWGLRLKTEDMAKFGQLYLQKGKWNDEQILPEEWVNEATTFKIDQAPGVPEPLKNSSDWIKGMTTRPGPNLLLAARGYLAGIPPVQTAGIYRWRDEKILEFTLRYIESPHTEIITCKFEGDKISVDTKYSYMPAVDLPDLMGRAEE